MGRVLGGKTGKEPVNGNFYYFFTFWIGGVFGGGGVCD
jgi:hypothetical protein